MLSVLQKRGAAGGNRAEKLMAAVRHLATKEELDATLREQEPPLQRPDMPHCHAKDLRVPKSFQEATSGEYGEQFRDAVKREVHGLLASGVFVPVSQEE